MYSWLPPSCTSSFRSKSPLLFWIGQLSSTKDKAPPVKMLFPKPPYYFHLSCANLVHTLDTNNSTELQHSPWTVKLIPGYCVLDSVTNFLKPVTVRNTCKFLWLALQYSLLCYIYSNRTIIDNCTILALSNFIKHQDPHETSVSKVLALQVSLLPLSNCSGFMVVLCILTSGIINTLLAGQQEEHLVKIDHQNSEITRYSPQEARVMHHKVAT